MLSQKGPLWNNHRRPISRIFFSKTELSRREARWLEFLSQFGMSRITLQKDKVHVLRDLLFQTLHAPTMETLKINTIYRFSPELSVDYSTTISSDQTFSSISKASKRTFLVNKLQKKRLTRLTHNFNILDEKLFHDSWVRVFWRLVKQVLHQAHESNPSRHFVSLKTLTRLSSFHAENKTQDV